MSHLVSLWRTLRGQHAHAFAVALGIALYLLLGILLWWGLDWYIQPKSSTAKKDLMQALGLIMAGVAGGVGIYFTWRNLQNTQENLRLSRESLEATRESNEQNIRLTREGQITERFTRAIDQLGATDDKGKKKLEVRLGGIYALERIARDSERDHWPIIETLTTYVREHAPWPPKKPEDPTPEAIPVPEPDIQAILSVLGRRARHFGNGEIERLDLNETALRKGNLREAHLEGASLWGAHLEGAKLRGANLEGADLWRANLEQADLREANLERAKNLTEEQIRLTFGDETTKLPEGLKRPAAWVEEAGKRTEEDE